MDNDEKGNDNDAAAEASEVQADTGESSGEDVQPASEPATSE